MLCKIALGWFFSGANQVRWWRLEYLMSFLPCGWIGSLLFMRNEKKQCANFVRGLQKV